MCCYIIVNKEAKNPCTCGLHAGWENSEISKAYTMSVRNTKKEM